MNEDRFRDQSLVLWSKTNIFEYRRGNEELQHHLLFYHLLDSAAVAESVWAEALSTAAREWVSGLLNQDESDTRLLLAFWCGLHDIGKVSPVFQKQIHLMGSSEIEQAGFPFPKNMDMNLYHSQASAHYLMTHFIVPLEIAAAISGHHGEWSLPANVHRPSLGEGRWDEYRAKLVAVLDEVIKPPKAVISLDSTQERNTLTTWFSGFLSVVDWIASNRHDFHFYSDFVEPADYYQAAKQTAHNATYRIGWVGWKPRNLPASFAQMFPDTPNPRRIQQAVFDAFARNNSSNPFIMILEAPTGIGKTEMALYCADRWLQNRLGGGIYVAMPSQATSNQMFNRLTKALKDRYPDELVAISLAHGQADWNDNLNNIRITSVGEKDTGTVFAADWFQNNRKQTLLAPFGVGTVDQAFMGVLRVKHFFVRLFGLSHKVMIFDEVHAYDQYMMELFARLLPWLRRMGASVIILSATLSEDFHRRIIEAYCGKAAPELVSPAYPRLTLVTEGGTINALDLKDFMSPAERNRALKISWQTDELCLSALTDRLKDGGCAAIICNTVARAISVFQELESRGWQPGIDLLLFHARFPRTRRKQIEDEVLKRFGKSQENGTDGEGFNINPARPARAILVATQVIEQSLDLDFDIMLSDLAPVDLILQRAGRVWRHHRRRPEGIDEPEIMLIQPKRDAEGRLDFGSKRNVYARSIKARTYLALQDLPKEKVSLIEQTRELIEKVYGNQDFAELDAGLAHQLNDWEQDENEDATESKVKANSALVLEPECSRLLSMKTILQDSDDPGLHKSYHALTRETDGLSLQIICLNRLNGNMFVDEETVSLPIDLKNLANNQTLAKAVLGQELSLNNNHLIVDLLNCSEAIKVDDVPALRYKRVLGFIDGRFETGSYLLELSEKYGLQITKKE